MSKIYLLEPEVTREDFDRVFDAHWHSAFTLRHLVYKASRGEVKEQPLQVSPVMSKKVSNGNGPGGSVIKQFSASSGKNGNNALAKRIHCESQTESDEDDDF